MAKRLTALDKAIQNIDQQIGALQIARAHLIDQQPHATPQRAPAKPKRTGTIVVEKIG